MSDGKEYQPEMDTNTAPLLVRAMLEAQISGLEAKLAKAGAERAELLDALDRLARGEATVTLEHGEDGSEYAVVQIASRRESCVLGLGATIGSLIALVLLLLWLVFAATS